MLRKSIIMMALAAAFTMNVSAVQIEVSKGQPPVPGPMRVFLLMRMRIIGILIKLQSKRQSHIVSLQNRILKIRHLRLIS